MQLDEVPAPSAAAAENLLRIVDEALANVLRHSGATRVTLSLRCDAADAQLVIADNGRGTGPSLRSGMGLANMRERANALPRGRFEFDGAAAQGTRVRIVFSTAQDRPA
jgi:signal transduction histidine kinase